MAVRLVIIQASSLCNLNCNYCYVPERQDRSRIDPITLENTIKKVLRSNLILDKIRLLFHAGEPLAVGIEFYRKVIKLVEKHNIYGREVIYVIQTNGTMINDKWCELFKEKNFEIGVSADGPAFLHDKQRKGWKGEPTHDRVLQGIECLRKHEINFGGICVLTPDSLNYPKEIFHFFLKNGFKVMGFNVEEKEGTNTHSSFVPDSESEILDLAEKYKIFMGIIHELWIENGGKLRVRELQGMSSCISKWIQNRDLVFVTDEVTPLRNITIQKTGDISTYSPEMASGLPGDPRAFVVGNINEIDELEDIISDSNYKKLRSEIKNGIENCKRECEYFSICGGGSPANKIYENGSFESTETMYCKVHKKALIDLVSDRLITFSELAKEASFS